MTLTLYPDRLNGNTIDTQLPCCDRNPLRHQSILSISPHNPFKQKKDIKPAPLIWFALCGYSTWHLGSMAVAAQVVSACAQLHRAVRENPSACMHIMAWVHVKGSSSIEGKNYRQPYVVFWRDMKARYMPSHGSFMPHHLD